MALPRQLFDALPARRSLLSILLVLGVVGGALWPAPTSAQQVLVDDPTSVSPGAAQLEVWHSRRESWIVPALRVHPRLEVSLGTAFVRTEPEYFRAMKYAIEGKVLLRPGSSHRLGIATVVGVGTGSVGGPVDAAESIYAYVPLSQTIVPDRLTVYQNVGWLRKRSGTHRLTWGLRVDLVLTDRFTLIGEVYGEGHSTPSAQAALRTVLLPKRLEADLSVTRSGNGDGATTWITAGLTFTTSPLY